MSIFSERFGDLIAEAKAKVASRLLDKHVKVVKEVNRETSIDPVRLTYPVKITIKRKFEVREYGQRIKN